MLRYLILLLTFWLLPMPLFAAPAGCTTSWPEWEAFKKSFISEDGRVVDGNTEALMTTSEGQAYAMFFSLVANDRQTFGRLLNWTENNLAEGDLASRLPAWAWGKGEGGEWGVLDENSASDADLWMAYALGEAGRLWGDRRYVALSSIVANRILETETRSVGGLGVVLLPGASGFTVGDSTVRLNPSYVPLQLMRWFAVRSKDSRWAALLDSSRQLIAGSAPRGYAPDWVVYESGKGFVFDADDNKPGVGSYDAIRVYLWAGMLNRDAADYQPLLKALRPMAEFVERHGYPPESIQVATGRAGDPGSSGFSAAMVPFLRAAGLNDALGKQLQRIEAQPVAGDAYYDQVLSLYAMGWYNSFYRFGPDGNLTPRWMSSCQ
jgi:endoglucanase